MKTIVLWLALLYVVTASAGSDIDDINARIRARNEALKGQPPQAVQIDKGPSAAEQASAAKRLEKSQFDQHNAEAREHDAASWAKHRAFMDRWGANVQENIRKNREEYDSSLIKERRSGGTEWQQKGEPH